MEVERFIDSLLANVEMLECVFDAKMAMGSANHSVLLCEVKLVETRLGRREVGNYREQRYKEEFD